ncbi:MAG TPA: hypothetical protein VLA88_02920 [Candidatus Saccharimonadales bacterium]|nr:hypothetical protein [Candidatus Saccharimonadales bacterium]
MKRRFLVTTIGRRLFLESTATQARIDYLVARDASQHYSRVLDMLNDEKPFIRHAATVASSFYEAFSHPEDVVNLHDNLISYTSGRGKVFYSGHKLVSVDFGDTIADAPILTVKLVIDLEDEGTTHRHFALIGKIEKPRGWAILKTGKYLSMEMGDMPAVMAHPDNPGVGLPSIDEIAAAQGIVLSYS